MDKLKIKNEYPPNYEKIKAAFDVDGKEVCFAYGDTIYNPLKGDIPEHLMVHEAIHSKQQNTDPEGWWDRYLTDPMFRLEQEIQAYASQYIYVKRLYNEKVYSTFLDGLAHDLASEIYGNIITFDKARSAIRRFASTMV